MWKWLTNMVGCWNLGLRMIPNDRPRSSLGPPGDFGQKIPNKHWRIQIFAKTKSQQIMKNHDFSKDFDTNGWGPVVDCHAFLLINCWLCVWTSCGYASRSRSRCGGGWSSQSLGLLNGPQPFVSKSFELVRIHGPQHGFSWIWVFFLDFVLRNFGFFSVFWFLFSRIPPGDRATT